jgi:3-hydroxyacyl-CoA dehydrogenase/enoyl-CoA hydratase/3-hydroxybutyryl-CoA epimerase
VIDLRLDSRIERSNGSNTSTLPITGLASGVKRQDDFIGIHFFSPVHKMPLVEIIKGEKTSDETLARVFDYTLAIGKTPIVVNDSRGFFTSRVIGTFVNEAAAMLGEGVEPPASSRPVRRPATRRRRCSCPTSSTWSRCTRSRSPPARLSRTPEAPTSRTRRKPSSRR